MRVPISVVIGIVLIILGVLFLAIDKNQENISVYHEPISEEAMKEITHKETIPLYPIIGFIVLTGGILLVLFGSRIHKNPPHD